MKNSNWKQSLNEAQLEAVEHIDGPSLIIAGAGSGKTRTLTYKVLYMLEQGIPAERILLLTFTNRAAREMTTRMSGLAGSRAGRIYAGTFHKIGNIFLRKYAHHLGIAGDYTILDREDSISVMDQAMKSMSLPTNDKEFPGKKLLMRIQGLAKNKNCSPEIVIDADFAKFSDYTEVILKVFEKYESLKKTIGGIDFDDMLILWHQLMQDEITADTIKSQFDYILIDEYQDTNKIQADIADILSEEKRNLSVVGDDSQSIYSFRGADFGNIITFTERYPGAKIFKLELNYRSTKAILDLANSSIKHNKLQYKKELYPSNGRRGGQPVIKNFRNVYDQAEGILHEIKLLVRNGLSKSEIAVLYRSHYHSMELQMELTRNHIPFTIHSGLKFFEMAHIKTLVAFLRASQNLQDFVSWKRLLGTVQGIGPKSAEKIMEGISRYRHLDDLEAEKLISLSPKKSQEAVRELFLIFENIRKDMLSSAPGECVRHIMESGFFDRYLIKNFPNMDERMDDCRQFASFVEGFEKLSDLLDELSLVASGEDYYNGQEGIVLSSIHQAKGLEWKAVFIIWLCEGKFPVYKSVNIQEHLEEERRLFYVAVTRAKEKLYLSYPRLDSRNQYGYERPTNPSQFLLEIPPHLYQDGNDYY